MRHGKCVGAGVNDDAPLRAEVVAGDVEAPFDLRRRAALDLDGPETAAGQIEQEIDFGARRCAKEMRLRPFR